MTIDRGPMSGPSSFRPTAVSTPEVRGLEVVEALCRLQLEAHRLGCTIRVCEASEELRQLIRFAGLEGILMCDSGRQPEERDSTS